MAILLGWRPHPRLRVLKATPVDAELADGRAQSADLEVAPAPVGQHSVSLGLGIESSAVRTTASAGYLVTPELSQLACRIPVSHEMATSASTDTGPQVPSKRTLGGSGQPRSS